MVSLDLFVNNYFSNINTPFFNGAFYFATWLFNPVPFTVLLILSVFAICKRFGKREAVLFACAPILAFLVAWILKFSFDTARPVVERIAASGPAFPSAHTAVATAYFLSLLHFLRHTKDKFRRGIHVAFCILCPVFVGVSRLYFGVHWLSDVVAGYVVGALSVYVIIWMFKRNKIKQ